MKLVIFLTMIVLFSACVKEEEPTDMRPDPASPIETDNSEIEPALNIAGQKWHVFRYMPENSFQFFDVNDTLEFSDDDLMTYNEYSTQYALYSTPTHYVLTIYESPWGMISAGVTPLQLDSGEIIATQFSIIIPENGASSITIWMKRI
jgi:hypothetical protein